MSCRRRAGVAPVALGNAFSATGDFWLFLVRIQGAADHVRDVAFEITLLKLGMNVDGVALCP
ncbi:hypothetical protein D3C78_1539510 [compost metagenome]